MRFAEMPLEAIPKPYGSALSPESHVPYRLNPHFLGREDVLRRVAAVLKSSSVFDATVITGIAGVGKSQLAAEVAHRYGPYFTGGVLWLDFAEPANARAEVANCVDVAAHYLDVKLSELTLDERVEVVLAAWKSSLPRLLIFDNCEDAQLLERYRPKMGGCRLLVTSRRAEWPSTVNVRTLSLDVLTPEASSQLLRRYVPQNGTDAELRAIGETLGYLPLALHLAGSYMDYFRDADFGQPARYLEQLSSDELLDHPSLQGRGVEHSPTGYELNVAKTLALTVERLNPQEEIDYFALELLRRAAVFAPGEAIPKELLLNSCNYWKIRSFSDIKRLVKRNRRAHYEAKDASYEEALKRLVNLGLLKPEEANRFKLHRLTSLFVRRLIDDDEAYVDVEEAVYREASSKHKGGDLVHVVEWQVHLRHITDSVLQRGSNKAAELSREFANHLTDVGSGEAALAYFEQALQRFDQTLGEMNITTAGCRNDYGLGLKAADKTSEAEIQLERAFEVRKLLEKPPGLNVAMSFNNLGDLFSQTERLDEALKYHRKALEIRLNHHEPPPAHIASSHNNIGYVFLLKKQYPEALREFNRALKLVEASEYKHHNIAFTFHSIGLAHEALGNLSEARNSYNQAYRLRKDKLGSEHRLTRVAEESLSRVETYLAEAE